MGMMGYRHLLLICVILASTVVSAGNPPHTKWYGQQRRVLTYLSENQCRYTYEGYEDRSPCPVKIPQYPIGDTGECSHAFSTIYLADCLFNHLKEVDKADMANAAVLLGLLPTVLSMAGSSTIETGMLALRRPLLALLVSAGSPAVNPLRTFEYRNTLELFETQHHHPNHISGLMTPKQTFIMVSEYVIGAGAVVNLLLTAWEVSVKTICATSMEFVWFPMIWTLLTIPVHLAGILAVYLRVQMTNLEPSAAAHTTGTQPIGRLRQFVWRHTREMLKLSECQTPIRLQLMPESELFRLISWTCSTGTVLHIIFGTMVLSGTLFICTADAIGVAGRFLLSTLTCRAILSYEMRGIGKTVITAEQGMELENRTSLIPKHPVHSHTAEF